MPDLIEPVTDPVPPPENRQPRRRRPGHTGPPRAGRRRYAWAEHADGQFHQWRDEPPGQDPEESARDAARIRLAAMSWAKARGGWVEVRSNDRGRQLWLAIHLPQNAGDPGDDVGDGLPPTGRPLTTDE